MPSSEYIIALDSPHNYAAASELLDGRAGILFVCKEDDPERRLIEASVQLSKDQQTLQVSIRELNESFSVSYPLLLDSLKVTKRRNGRS